MRETELSISKRIKCAEQLVAKIRAEYQLATDRILADECEQFSDGDKKFVHQWFVYGVKSPIGREHQFSERQIRDTFSALGKSCIVEFLKGQIERDSCLLLDTQAALEKAGKLGGNS